MEGLPHIQRSIIYNIDSDDTELYRGKLLMLMSVIQGRLDTTALVDHMIAPVSISPHTSLRQRQLMAYQVLLFSYMGPRHVRVLHAYFDGGELIIHHSKLIDFRQWNVEGLKFCCRWYMFSLLTGKWEGSVRSIRSISRRFYGCVCLGAICQRVPAGLLKPITR